MDSKAAIVNWPRSNAVGRALLLAGMALLLGLAACLPAATPSPAPEPTPTPPPSAAPAPTPGAPPVVSAGAERSTPSPVAGPGKGNADTGGQAVSGEAVVVSPGRGGPAVEARPLVDQTYQWVGVVVVSTLEGRHLELKRDCDSWVLLPQSEDLARKLEDNVGNKVVIWGKVFTGATIYMRQAIAVQSVFGPNDPMPMTLVAIPEYPCPGTPTPRPVPPVQPVSLLSGEIGARGTLVWEQGKPYLSMPAGRIALTLPPDQQSAPNATEATPAAGATPRPASLDVVAVGKWRRGAAGLELSAHTVRPWPVNLMAKNPCGNLTSIEPLQPGEISARGDLVWDGPTPLLKTVNGPIQLSFAGPQPSPPGGDAVVLGKWRIEATGVALTVRQIVPMFLPCPPPTMPPPQPTPSLLPGEVAAVGTLVWESGQPYLDTPSGRIVLSIPQELTPPMFEPASPDGKATPRPIRAQVIAAGKWSIKNGQLAIAARYLQSWPGPTLPDPVPPQPPPPPPPTPRQGQGTVYGRVRIGPLCPVEPCPSPQPDVYSSRALVLKPEVGEPTYVKLNPDGSFKAPVNSGTYTVDLTNCTFLGCKSSLPKKVSIAPNQAVLLEIDIDTGIR